MIFFVTGVPLYSRQRPPFYRERAGGLYRAGAYSAATLIAEIPWAFLGALIFQAVFMPLVGLRSTPDAFFWQTLAHFMTFVVYLWFAQMAVARLPSEAIAQVRASCDTDPRSAVLTANLQSRCWGSFFSSSSCSFLASCPLWRRCEQAGCG